ncbi:MAG: hypothetical protein MJ214_00895 [Bacilli bacterium]|nr:hypothetical protein [Bacilli bacterium]
MIFDYVIYIMVSLLAGLAGYYLTNNLYFLIGTMVIYLAYFVIYEFLFKRKERLQLMHNKDLTTFIHDFFLAYSVDYSLDNALLAAQENVSASLKEQVKMLEEFKGEEKLERLTDYFSSSLYQLFLKTISICNNKSEEHDKAISFLLEENNNYLLNQKVLQKSIWRALVEFSLLWIISFSVLIVIRFAVNSYFDQITKTGIYLIGIIFYFVFFLFSIHLFMRATRGRIKRYEE